MTLILIAAGSVVVTLVVVLVIANLTSAEKKIEYEITSQYGVDDPQFVRAIGTLLGPALIGGNRVELLANGQQIFPAMLKALREARSSICFETYIYWEGEVGEQFAEALIERASAGVNVHVLLDWLGTSKIDTRYLEKMKQAGVEVERYHPVRWYNLDRLNNRTHRKLLITDGRIGFTGGVGIADKWTGDAQDPEHWRDLHFRLEGPGVAQMQAAFMDNWMKTHSRVLHEANYFPQLAEAGTSRVQTFKSSPREGSESLRLMFLLSIACARSSLRIGNAYFVPDSLLVQALVDAQRRGVTVQVIVPGKHIDAAVVRRASRAQWGALLQAGVEIREYQPTMYHTKLMVVDERWTSVGSANFDNRSFRLNDESNLNVLDTEFAQRASREFDCDLERSRRISFEEWQARPLREKIVERLAALVRKQL